MKEKSDTGSGKAAQNDDMRSWQKILVVLFFIVAVPVIVFGPYVERHLASGGQWNFWEFMSDIGEAFVNPPPKEHRKMSIIGSGARWEILMDVYPIDEVLKPYDLDDQESEAFEEQVREAIEARGAYFKEWEGWRDGEHFEHPYSWELTQTGGGDTLAVWYVEELHELHRLSWD